MSKNKGITLIALVITIIILLILAGISIAILTGENGVLTKANTAKEEHKIAQYKEELNLIIAEEIGERKIEVKKEAMIVSLEEKIRKKDWVDKTSREQAEGISEEYLIVQSKEGYEFIIEVNEEKETAKIIQESKKSGQKYTITYHPNGGVGEPETEEVRSGFYKILEKNTFTREDYAFVGWCEKEEPDEETKPYLEGSKYQAKGNVILYAIWSYNAVTVTFDANTGTGNMENKKVIKGQDSTLPVNTFTKEDNDFVKWNTKADGTGKDYEDSSMINITEDITLYAIWKERVSIKTSIKNQTVFEEKTAIPDEYDNQVIIPEGFKVASDSGSSVPEGIVIEDVSAGNETTKGSQFVWIPVGEVKYKGGSKTITLDRYTFSDTGVPTGQGANTIGNDFQELATSTRGNTTAIDIEAFKTRTNTNHGYYIGRYEAGDPSATTNRTGSSSQDNPMICKEDQYVYNNITQIKAAVVSREMYHNKKITSDLINSYAWDTAIVFIQEFSGDTEYAMQEPIQSKLAKTGKATDGTNKDVKCNIYDMAGNCLEWSTETSALSSYPSVYRGGGCAGTGYYTSCRRSDLATITRNYASFRPILYW